MEPHFMKIHKIFIMENLHSLLFLTHFLVPRQFILLNYPSISEVRQIWCKLEK